MKFSVYKVMITDEEIIERIFQLEVTRIHFQNLLMRNDREMESNEIEVAFNMPNFISFWVQWKTSSKKEPWTAEPLKHFSGASKKAVEESIKLGQCWPWVERERIDVLKAKGKLALSFARNHFFLLGLKKFSDRKQNKIENHLKPEQK